MLLFSGEQEPAPLIDAAESESLQEVGSATEAIDGHRAGAQGVVAEETAEGDEAASRTNGSPGAGVVPTALNRIHHGCQSCGAGLALSVKAR